MTEMTDAQRKAFEAALARAKEAADNRDRVPTQRIRAAAQGATAGFSDEIEAAIRNPVSAFGSAVGIGNGEGYTNTLNEIRGGLKAYQEARPWESIGYELGGAVLPAVLTGGSGAAPTLGRLAAQGAIQGGLYAAGTGEGGFASRMARVPGGAVAGAVAAPVIGKVAGAAGRGAASVIDIARRRIGGRGAKVVENELRRLANDSGMTVDEIVDGVASGKIMAENKTLLDAVRVYRAEGGRAASMLTDTMLRRPAQTRNEAVQEIQQYLTGVADENVLKRWQMDDAAAKVAERQAYAPFKTQDAPEEVVQELSDALRRVPGSAEEATVALRAETGQSPFFKVVQEEGKPPTVEFTRTPSVGEAEVIRRAINNYATSLYRNSKGTAGEAVAGVETTLRNALDTTVPSLQGVRAEAASLRQARDAFDAGRKVFGRSADELEIEFEKLSADPNALKAFRAGVMDAIRNRMTSGRGKSAMGNFSNPDSKEGKVLRTIIDPADLDRIMGKVDNAASSQAAANRIIGGSDTAITEGQRARQGIDVTGEDVVAVMSGDMMATLRTARKVVKSMAPTLTDAQRAKIVEVLLSEDPYFVRAALQDQSALALIQNKVNSVANRLEGAAGGAATVPAANIGGSVTGLLAPQ